MYSLPCWVMTCSRGMLSSPNVSRTCAGTNSATILHLPGAAIGDGRPIRHCTQCGHFQRVLPYGTRSRLTLRVQHQHLGVVGRQLEERVQPVGRAREREVRMLVLGEGEPRPQEVAESVGRVHASCPACRRTMAPEASL